MMTYRIVPSKDEIDEVLVKTGDAPWPGPRMTYMQGVEAALLWVTGQSDENPAAE